MDNEKPAKAESIAKISSIKPNYKIIAIGLLLIIFVMLFVWKPWQPNIKAADRTISVTGEATVKATPDQYIFTPSYTFTSNVSKTAQAELTAKSNEIVTHLKSMGVPDKAIKTTSSGSSRGGNDIYTPTINQPNGNATYYLSVTVTLDNKDLVQKVQDYLITTNPTGNISPAVNFSTSKQNALQNQARSLAEQDARTKANQSAKNLGFKVAAVKTVEDGNLGIPTIMPYSGVPVSALSSDKGNSLAVQPGQNDLSYSVSVVYYIR